MNSKATVDYVVDLHRRNAEYLGFIRRSRIELYAAAGQVWMAEEGGDSCGYIMAKSRSSSMALPQAIRRNNKV